MVLHAQGTALQNRHALQAGLASAAKFERRSRRLEPIG